MRELRILRFLKEFSLLLSLSVQNLYNWWYLLSSVLQSNKASPQIKIQGGRHSFPLPNVNRYTCRACVTKSYASEQIHMVRKILSCIVHSLSNNLYQYIWYALNKSHWICSCNILAHINMQFYNQIPIILTKMATILRHNIISINTYLCVLNTEPACGVKWLR